MKPRIVVLALLALIAGSCGSGATETAPPGTDPVDSTTSTVAPAASTIAPPDEYPTTAVEVFFIKDGVTAQSVARTVGLSETEAGAVRAVISGPSYVEEVVGLSSAIPPGTNLLNLVVVSGLATVDLSAKFEAGGGSFSVLSRLAQVVYTLTAFDSIDEVLFLLEGETVDVFSVEGVNLSDPVGRDDYESILPIGADSALSGSARVVLVTDRDVLNIRSEPGAAAEVIGAVLPGELVELTGDQEIVGSSIWVEITAADSGWVNSHFLAVHVAPEAFADDPDVDDLLNRFLEIINNEGDLSEVTSQRGLYVSHHSAPIRFSPDLLTSILTDSTTYQWSSNALADDELDEIPERTFAEAVTDSFDSAFDDTDSVLTVNQPVEAGNGRLPEYAIPFEFASFNYIAVHDPGDNPEYDGLDWITWYVSIDHEAGVPVIVGLTIDQWAP